MGWTVVGSILGPEGPAGIQGATGATGPQGPQGATGTAGTNFRGPWAAGTVYAQGDIVTENGGGFIAPGAIGANNNPNTSGDGRTATNGWSLFVSEGAVGPQGPQGIAGEAGPQGNTGSQGPAGTTGSQGSAGATGPTGATGGTGARGSKWFTGNGAPGTIAGAVAGDQYLDATNGNVYTLS